MPKQSIIERLNEQPVVFDGAMGTEIYSRGVFLNRCFDELCLTDPDLIRAVHHDYIEAGAEVIETNTFGANRIWLKGYGLADKAAEINRTGARLAREVAGDEVWVAGSVGPCLRQGQMLNDERQQLAREAFAEAIGALAEGGVDFIMLETFADLKEVDLALEAAATAGLPTIVSFAIDSKRETARGARVEDFAAELDRDERVHAIGLNCGTGPAPLHTAAERLIPGLRKPLIVMPNAGLPTQVEGRTIYLVNPDYFTAYAKKLVKSGVRGVGGCCGTTPEHIRIMAKAVRALSGVKQHIEIKPLHRTAEQCVEPTPTGEKSRIGARLARGQKVTSVEILPPKSWDLTKMVSKVRQCYLAGVDAINIPDGPRASARISPMIAAIEVQRRVGIEPILHYCCRDRNLIGMQSDLLGGCAAGLTNFLIVTGDPPKIGDYPDVTGVFDVDAIGLTQIATNLNHGLDIGGNPIDPPAGILIGVGANPCALDLKHELDRFRRKIDAGAEFAITQPVFDAEALLRFLDEVDKFPRRIPVVAGLWPLASYKNAEFMKNEVPGVEIPDDVMQRMAQPRTKEEGWQMGIDIAREIRDRIHDRVGGFQASAPFGKVDLAIRVLV